MPRRGQSGASAAARKAALDAKAKYDAAGTGRRVAGWNPGVRGPQRATQGVPKLRERSRDATRNDWAAAAFVQKWATTLVGVAITPRWKETAINEAWRKFVPHADADGVVDAYGLMTLGVREWFEGGEVFLRRRPRSLTAPLPAPVQYQLIEAEFCPFFDADTWQGMPNGNNIRQGIERNAYGRRVAYWMYREHPGDKDVSPSPDQLLRVPASEIRHVFEPKRAGQMRGVPESAAMLVRLRSSADFEDAVLDRQKLANLFVAWITRAIPENADIEYDSDTGLPKWYDSKGNPMVGLEPGIMQELQPGEKVEFSNPPEAGTTFSDYMRTTHIGTAAGGSMPYEMLVGDIKDVSDRTYRVVINEFRRFARQRQWQVIIPMLCQPMVDWWVDARYLKGEVAVDQIDAHKAPKWSPEGWEYIHPTQDAEGKRIELEIGITSRERIAGERGDDIEEIDAERKADKTRSDKLGLSPPEPAKVKPTGTPAPKPAQPNALETFAVGTLAAMTAREAEPPPPPPAPGPDVAELVARGLAEALLKFQQQNEAAAERMAERFAAEAAEVRREGAAAITQAMNILDAALKRPTEMHAHIQPTPIQNNVSVEPTPVEMHTHVEPTPVTNVLEQTIVAKAELKEIAIVSMPERKTTTDVDRDPNSDEITGTTQIERDVPPKPKK